MFNQRAIALIITKPVQQQVLPFTCTHILQRMSTDVNFNCSVSDAIYKRTIKFFNEITVVGQHTCTLIAKNITDELAIVRD